MKTIVFTGLVALTASLQPAHAQTGASSWTDLEYVHAAKCAWAKYPGVAAGIAKTVHKTGRYAGAISRKSILSCVNVTNSSSVDRHLGNVNNTPFDSARLGDEIALVPLLKIANCVLGGKPASRSAIAEVKRSSALSEGEIAAARRCDATAADQLMDKNGHAAKAYKEALVRQMDWNRKLAAWPADLQKQHDSAKIAGCAWRTKELATRRLLVQHGYQRPGVTMRRYAGPMSPVITPCMLGKGYGLHVVKIMDEIIAFTSY